MSEASVHDYTLFGYEVDGRAQRITLHTEGSEPSHVPVVDVVFEGVVTYRFVDDALTSILFGIF
jgi:hypothetical protein